MTREGGRERESLEEGGREGGGERERDRNSEGQREREREREKQKDTRDSSVLYTECMSDRLNLYPSFQFSFKCQVFDQKIPKHPIVNEVVL